MIAAADSFRALGNPGVRDQASSSLLSVEDGVATVSISGPIIHKTDIRAVFLNIDSPGGTVAGTPERIAPMINDTGEVKSLCQDS